MSSHTKLFDFDPLTGTTQYWHYNALDDTATIETVQDITDIAELNQGLRNHFDERSNWKGDLHKVASIPMTIYNALGRKGMLPHQDPAAFKRWMNDPDNRVFRTRPGRV